MKKALAVVLVIIMLSSMCRCFADNDGRTIIRVALYGQAAEAADMMKEKLDNISPDYTVELSFYKNSPEDMARLISALSSEQPPDLIISEGYLADPSWGTDLYPFIDADDELSRESFLPFMLKGLEREGKLPQIWGRFGLSTALATGVLAEADELPRLTECQAYLDNLGYTTPLFDGDVYAGQVLQKLSDKLVSIAYDAQAGEYEFDKGAIRELLEFCARLPVDETRDVYEALIMSEVISWRDVSLEYLSWLEQERTAFKFFDTPENAVAQVAAWYRSCYMIPESCTDKEKAWGFLREMLLCGYQLEECGNDFGYPTNAEAFDTLVSSSLTADKAESLEKLTELAAFCGYESTRIRIIFIDCLKPYLSGRVELDAALADAQSKTDAYRSERNA